MTGPARWLIAGHPGQLDLYQHLEQRFGGVGSVEVIVDRRKGERRQVTAPPSEAEERPDDRVFPQGIERGVDGGRRLHPLPSP